MAQTSEHIVTAFDEELQQLSENVARMGGLAEAQITGAIEALAKRDTDLASRVVNSDSAIDALEEQLNQDAVRLLALRQPMATDLREVICALKISSNLERIGDLASNIAKRVIALNQSPPIEPARAIPRLARLVQNTIKDTLDAYVDRDSDRALDVWHRDEEVDEMYTGLFRQLLTYMMEDPRNISAGTHLLFVAKNIERMGDHATNIAETTFYLVTGRPMEGERVKADSSSFEVAKPPQKVLGRKRSEDRE